MAARFLDSKKIEMKRSDSLRAREICTNLYKMMPQLPIEKPMSKTRTAWTTGPVLSSISATPSPPTSLTCSLHKGKSPIKNAGNAAYYWRHMGMSQFDGYKVAKRCAQATRQNVSLLTAGQLYGSTVRREPILCKSSNTAQFLLSPSLSVLP